MLVLLVIRALSNYTIEIINKLKEDSVKVTSKTLNNVAIYFSQQ